MCTGGWRGDEFRSTAHRSHRVSRTTMVYQVYVVYVVYVNEVCLVYAVVYVVRTQDPQHHTSACHFKGPEGKNRSRRCEWKSSPQKRKYNCHSSLSRMGPVWDHPLKGRVCIPMGGEEYPPDPGVGLSPWESILRNGIPPGGEYPPGGAGIPP